MVRHSKHVDVGFQCTVLVFLDVCHVGSVSIRLQEARLSAVKHKSIDFFFTRDPHPLDLSTVHRENHGGDCDGDDGNYLRQGSGCDGGDYLQGGLSKSHNSGSSTARHGSNSLSGQSSSGML